MSDELKSPSEYGLAKELGGTTCRCGRGKARSQTFCRGHYFSLPVPLRRRLYNLLGEGYAEAYVDACRRLGLELPAGAGKEPPAILIEPKPAYQPPLDPVWDEAMRLVRKGGK
jgi:hypothetical protein